MNAVFPQQLRACCARQANRAMQCLGGYGYVGEYQVERLWRDAKLIEIGGGTLEAHQKNITRELSKMDVLA
jgi:isovaleryl-CoA dehydrogenase